MNKKLISAILSIIMIFGNLQNVSASETMTHTEHVEEKENNTESDEVTTSDMIVRSIDVKDSLAEDSETLFEGFLNNLFSANDIALLSFIDEFNLNDLEINMYTQVEQAVMDIVSGARIDTEIQLLENESGNLSWTYEELGLSGWTDSNRDTVLVNVLYDTIDFHKISQYLCLNHPYEMFWFDKTSEATGITMEISDRDGSEIIIDHLSLYYAVSAEYQADSVYSLDNEKIITSQRAVSNAQNILNEAEGLPDYEKLVYYKQQICQLVSYDYAANGEEYSIKDDGLSPWQLVSVFDGDGSTNVVCEGYAKAFQYLCDLTEFDNININCVCVTGTMDDGTGTADHMWNIVRMDNLKNYVIDVTNCDEGTIGADSLLFLVGTSDSVNHGYSFRIDDLNIVTYIYDSDTLELFDDFSLKIASENYTQDSVEECSHTTIALIKEKAATCTEDGYSGNKVCQDCGKIVEKGTKIPSAGGHTWVNRVIEKEPTKDSAGLQTALCSICGETEEVPYYGLEIASGKCGESAYWFLNQERTLYIYGNGKMDDYYVNISTPWIEYQDEIVSLCFEEGITYIGAYSFGSIWNNECWHSADHLKNVSFAESIKKIGAHAFRECKSLENFTLPSGLTTMGDYAFVDCDSITRLTLPSSLNMPGFNAFKNCDQLEYVYFDDAPTTNEWYSLVHDFDNCPKLKSIDVGPNHPVLVSKDGVVYDKPSLANEGKLLYYPAGKTDSSYTVPDFVEIILQGAFCENPYLNEIIIPKSVTEIQSDAFKNCIGLGHIELPDSIKHLNSSLFSGCSNLTSIILPDTIEDMDIFVFDGCKSLTSISIPYGIETIPHDAFQNCSSLINISFPETVTNIENYVFHNCTGLKNITIPNSTAIISDDFIDSSMYDKIVIHGYEGSTAETFAKERNIAFRIIHDNLWISSQPEPVTACIRSSVSFHIEAENAVSYQWQYSKDNGTTWSNSTIASAKTDTLELTVSKTNYQNIYRCEVTGKNGEIEYSDPAAIDLIPWSEITLQPESPAMINGETVKFHCEASNAASYQWQYSKDGTSWKNSTLTSAKTDTLSIKVSDTNSMNIYRCQVTGIDGNKINSNKAVFVLLTQQPEPCSAPLGTKASYTIKAENAESYQWQYSKDGGVTWSNSTLTSAKTDTLTFTVAASNQANLYRCKMKTTTGVYAYTKPVGYVDELKISAQPSDVTVEGGASATFKVAATGKDLTYQWQYSKDGGKTWVNSTVASAKTASLKVTIQASYDGRLYRCVIKDGSGKTVYSNGAKVTIAVSGPVIITEPMNLTGRLGENARFSVHAENVASYQWQYSKDGVKWTNSTLANAKTDTITFKISDSNKANRYRCKLVGEDGTTLYTKSVAILLMP